MPKLSLQLQPFFRVPWVHAELLLMLNICSASVSLRSSLGWEPCACGMARLGGANWGVVSRWDAMGRRRG